MSFAGHAFDAISKVRMNRAPLLLRRQRTRDRIRKLYNDALRYPVGEYREMEVPPEKLRRIKSEIRRKLRREEKIRSLYAAALSILVIGLMALVVWVIGSRIN